ncbi:MAG: hypothetical protein EBV00_05995, partial [Burkholderiaceae bacterium]|nr:hypothetical protein [Burkholderiaceae bacterium]
MQIDRTRVGALAKAPSIEPDLVDLPRLKAAMQGTRREVRGEGLHTPERTVRCIHLLQVPGMGTNIPASGGFQHIHLVFNQGLEPNIDFGGGGLFVPRKPGHGETEPVVAGNLDIIEKVISLENRRIGTVRNEIGSRT